MSSFLFNLTDGSALLLSLAIIVSTIILEDPTTVVVGLLASDGIIPVPLALVSLYVGTVLGDTGLYCLGNVFQDPCKAPAAFAQDLSIFLTLSDHARFP